jgi:hypothetical protein
MGRKDPVNGVLADQINDALERADQFRPIGLEQSLRSQCLAVASAATLRIPVGRLPRVPMGADRWDRWVALLEEDGYVVEDLDRSELPPSDGMPWVAIIESGFHTHAVGVIGTTAIDGSLRNIQPASVLSAFRVVDA